MASSEVCAELSGLTDRTVEPTAKILSSAVPPEPPTPVSPSPSASSSLSDLQRAVLEPEEDDHLNDSDVDSESELLRDTQKPEEEHVTETEADAEKEGETECLSYHTYYSKGDDSRGISFRIRSAGKKKFVTVRHNDEEELEAEFILEKLRHSLSRYPEDEIEMLEAKRLAEFDNISMVACGLGAAIMCFVLFFISLLLQGNAKINACSSGFGSK
jgi:hypothetical protein